ncbi:hypothetical protein B0H11DRAFT_2002347 [Mycena galericulata]|nr:hypothetical protein B0H11DRAFT_2002347 [Mycena galericulata]
MYITHFLYLRPPNYPISLLLILPHFTHLLHSSPTHRQRRHISFPLLLISLLIPCRYYVLKAGI